MYHRRCTFAFLRDSFVTFVLLEANGARWPSRSSKSVAAPRGQAGFDSQALPPTRTRRHGSTSHRKHRSCEGDGSQRKRLCATEAIHHVGGVGEGRHNLIRARCASSSTDELPVATAITRAPIARAHATSCGVSPITTALSRASARNGSRFGAPQRHLRQLSAIRRVLAKRAPREIVAHAEMRQLDVRGHFVIAGQERRVHSPGRPTAR